MGSQPRYRDASLAIEERAADLIGRMTLDEKLAQLTSYWSYEILNHEVLDEGKAAEKIGSGIGQITRVAGQRTWDSAK